MFKDEDAKGRMKFIPVLTFVLGVVATIILVAESGTRETAEALGRAGWGVLLAALIRILAISVAGVAWWRLMPGPGRPGLHICVKARLMREAGNTLLPVAQIGGDLAGVRIMTLYGVAAALAAASIITDIFVQATSQILFTIIGVVLLAWSGRGAGIVEVVAWGLAAAVPLLIGFYLAQRASAGRLIGAALRRIAGDKNWRAIGATDQLFSRLAAIQARPGRIAASGVVHLGVWIFGSLEVFVVLAFMGYPVSFADAIAIESLTQALRGAAVAVPGALGVQEGGLVVLCALYGIPIEAALALSLSKRAADLALGVPALIGWYRLEHRGAASPTP